MTKEESIDIDELTASLKANKKVEVVRIIKEVSAYRRTTEIILIPTKEYSPTHIIDLDGLQELLEGLVSCRMEIQKFEQVGDDIYFGYLHTDINVIAAVNKVKGEKWEDFTIRLYPNVLIAIPAAYCGNNIYHKMQVTKSHYFQMMIAAHSVTPHLAEIGLLLSNLAKKNDQ